MFNLEELKAKKLLTRQEAAFYLGNISLPTLDREAQSPNFPHQIRFGRRVFYSREELDRWIAEKSKY